VRSSASSRAAEPRDGWCCAAWSAGAQRFVQEKPYLVASYEPLVEARKDAIEIDGLGMAVYERFEAADRDLADIPDETAQVLDQHKDPARLATSSPRPSTFRRKSVRRCWSRSTWRSGCAAAVLLQRKVELIRVKQKIDSQVREEFSKHQREAVPRRAEGDQDELARVRTRATWTRSRRRSRPRRCRKRSRRPRASNSSA